jgi:serine/threonine protein kinase
MNETTPVPHTPSDPVQDARDEALGTQLDHHLQALQQGTTPDVQGGADTELSQLRPVVVRLFRLSQDLAAPTTVDYPAVPAYSTMDSPRSATHNTSSARAVGPLATVGKFEVVRRLGHGGQAATVLALDPDLRRHVVLKVYHSAQTPKEQETVLREGQALARVRSPYVAQCYSAERADGVPFLVMEYIPGRNLSGEHRAHPLTAAQALAVIGQLALGLTAVHACGLLHRDIKPANVLMGEDGRPRLVDFGLAAALASDELSDLSGTLAYMAPEQARRQVERIDARTDLYGLGAVLYHLLTGRPPHLGSTTSALLEAARVGDVTPPVQLNPTVPPAVSDLCMRCLARDPANRFASAAEVAEAVRRLQQPQPQPQPQPRPRWPLVAAIAVGLAAAVLVAGLVFSSGETPRPPLGPVVVQGPDAGKRPAPPEQTAKLDVERPMDPEVKPAVKAEAGPELVSAPYLKGRPLRRDFPMKVDIVGSAYDPKTKAYRLRVGEQIYFRVRLEENAYVGVWNVTDKSVVRLFPNDNEPNNFLEKGKTTDVPETRVQGSKPTRGMEFVHILASTRPLREADIPPQLRSFGGVYLAYSIPEAYEKMTGALRDLELVPPRRPFSARRSAASEVILPFRVLPKDDSAGD